MAKMEIVAYSDAKFGSEVKRCSVQFNPASFNLAYSIEYDNKQSPGTKGRDMKFKKVNPTDISFDFLFDGTGVAGHKGSVMPQVRNFVETVWGFNGSAHRTHYVKIIWGDADVFSGVLTNLTLQYKLFKPDATPIRVLAQAKFKSSYEDGVRVAMENKNSPDLTHIRDVKAGDKLPLMTQAIYGSTDYYMEIARINGLTNFRQLEPGTQLYFPPIDKMNL